MSLFLGYHDGRARRKKLTTSRALSTSVTSGCGAIYFQNVLNALPDSALVRNYHKKGVFNPQGSKLVAGQRLLPGKVTRAIDANHVRIQQEVKMNGAFRYALDLDSLGSRGGLQHADSRFPSLTRLTRIHVMAGRYATSKPALAALDRFISSPSSFVNLYRPASKSVQAATVFNSQETRHIEPEHGQREPNHNPFFTFLTVFADPHTEWDVSPLLRCVDKCFPDRSRADTTGNPPFLKRPDRRPSLQPPHAPIASLLGRYPRPPRREGFQGGVARKVRSIGRQGRARRRATGRVRRRHRHARRGRVRGDERVLCRVHEGPPEEFALMSSMVVRRSYVFLFLHIVHFSPSFCRSRLGHCLFRVVMSRPSLLSMSPVGGHQRDPII